MKAYKSYVKKVLNSLLKSYEGLSKAIKKDKVLNSFYDPFIQFLGMFIYQINTQAEGMAVIEQIGAEALSTCTGKKASTSETQGIEDSKQTVASEHKSWTKGDTKTNSPQHKSRNMQRTFLDKLMPTIGIQK